MKIKYALFSLLTLSAISEVQAKVNEIAMVGAALTYQEKCSSVDNMASEHVQTAFTTAQDVGLTQESVSTNSEHLGSLNYGLGLAEGVFITYDSILKKPLAYSCKQLYIGLIGEVYGP
ncbi:hypothetical protein N2M06_08145 [Oceanimonas sp. AH20CE76]|uniref:hypothetical protein n=1 Tax=Oceanimonas sp. AH20CE76 TaxID=2977120 RepID=UPI0031FE679C